MRVLLLIQMMIANFRKDEIRAWYSVGTSDYFPKLYMFSMEGNRIVMRMQKIKGNEILYVENIGFVIS
jgi:hypothetical protein